MRHAVLHSVNSQNIERLTQILGSKFMDRYLFTYLGTKTSHNFSQLTRKSLVPTDNFLYPYLQHQNIHLHVLVTGNQIICISNSHQTQYLGFVNYIDMLSKIQPNNATLCIEQLQKRTEKISSSVN